MNTIFEIKKSSIAGNGAFANQDIKKGQNIYFLQGELCTLDEILKRVDAGEEEPSDPLGVDDEAYLDLEEFSRTINHSCNPNSYIKGQNELVALKDIAAGTEITYDYSTTMDDNEEKIVNMGHELWTCPCHCGSKNCREVIHQFKTLPKQQQEYYIRNRFMPDFMLKKFLKDKIHLR